MNDKTPNDDFQTNSIVQPGQHFRLRAGGQIVGYMNVRDERIVFYSRDQYIWTDTQIKHDAKDRSTEVYDVNRIMIFENDIVQLRRDASMPYTKRGVVAWHHTYRTLVVKLIEEDSILMLDVPNHQAPFRDDLKVISHF